MTDTGPSDTGAGVSRPILNVAGLRAGYGPIEVLHGMDFTVGVGEIVVILGANGAGKTTTMRCVSGMIEREGTVEFEGRDIASAKPDAIVRGGISQVPQGRGTFTDLTVNDNLLAGAYTVKDSYADELEYWYRDVPAPCRAARPEGRVVVRRRATDARHRQGDDEQAEIVVVRRAEPRPRADHHTRAVPHPREAPRRIGDVAVDRRTERRTVARAWPIVPTCWRPDRSWQRVPATNCSSTTRSKRPTWEW